MTGQRGKKPEVAVPGEASPDKSGRVDGTQTASKKEIKKTQQMVSDLEEKISDLNETLDNVNKKISTNETKFSQHELRLAYLEAKTSALLSENKRLSDRVDQLENEKRATNLKIDGVKEEDRENLSDVILKIAAAVGVRCQPPDIDLVYRIGKSRDGYRVRPILVSFKTRAVRDNIFYGRAKLRGNDNWRNVFVNDDVNDSTRKKREGLRAISLLCKVKNIDHRLHADSIVISGRKYSEHQLNALPVGLRLEDAKTLKTEKGILFQSKHSFLSSFNEAPFIFDKVVHNTVEHGLNYKRAQSGNRPDIAELIHQAATPLEAKRLGKLVAETKEFKEGKDDLMESMHFEKFAQNPHLQMKLVKTGDAKLLEATYDEHFGIGKPLNLRLLRDITWTGKNILGEILERIRGGFVGE